MHIDATDDTITWQRYGNYIILCVADVGAQHARDTLFRDCTATYTWNHG